MRQPVVLCHRRGVWSVGTVRVWRREQGWGVIDAPETPGGCWAHFSHLWSDEHPTLKPGEAASSGQFRELFEGEVVDFTWRHPGQDGYDYAALSVRPRDNPAPRWRVRRLDDAGYREDEAAGQNPSASSGFSRFTVDGEELP